MNIALILAGGIDPNFKMDIPKQFVHVNNKPVIVYTLEAFQKCPEIDAIMVASIPGWESMIQAYAKQFHIDKLRWVIQGGISGQETSYLAAKRLKEECSADDIIVIHDGIRPLVMSEIIEDSIYTCKKKGMGIAAVTSMDNVMLTDDGVIGKLSISRYAFRRIQTPQTYYLKDLYEYHMEANEKQIKNENDTNNMVAKLGKNVFFSKGSDTNIKINTVEDIEMFKALYALYHFEEN